MLVVVAAVAGAAGAGGFRPVLRLLGLVGVPGDGLGAGLTPVLFITDVRLLRMELILARSTLARFGRASAGEGERREVAFTGFGGGATVAMLTVTGAQERGFGILPAGFAGMDVDGAVFSTNFSFLSSTMILDPSSSTSESSMSSTSRLSVAGSGVADFSLSMVGDRDSSPPIPWKGDSEPVGEGASMLGEGTGDSSGSGRVAFN